MVSIEKRNKIFKNKINRLKKLTKSTSSYEERVEINSNNIEKRKKLFK